MITKKYDSVQLGVGVIVKKGKEILLAKRKNSHGAGCWTPPGGHLEPGETVMECAIRETFEESGIIIQPQQMLELGFTEDFFPDEGKHYITCFVLINIGDEKIQPTRKEPHKFETEWQWFEYPTHLPENIFLPAVNALKKFNKIKFVQFLT